MDAEHPHQVFVFGKRRHLRGWRRDQPDHRDLHYPTSASSVAALPKKVDLTSLNTGIENQGELGSCTANASTSAMECLDKKQGRPVTQLSRLYLYYYTRKVEGTPPTEDSGCQIRDVMKTLAVFGCATESAWPYNLNKWTTAPSYTAFKTAQSHKATQYFRCGTLAAVRKSLADGYPVVGGFSVPESMLGDDCSRTGVVQLPEPGEGIVGGHAILFMGYDDDLRLLTFANSWGTAWGKNGYGFLDYGYFEQGLANDCWTIRRDT